MDLDFTYLFHLISSFRVMSGTYSTEAEAEALNNSLYRRGENIRSKEK